MPYSGNTNAYCLLGHTPRTPLATGLRQFAAWLDARHKPSIVPLHTL